MADELTFDFEFENPPSFDDNPILQPLAGETGGEGGSLKGYAMAQDYAPDFIEAEQPNITNPTPTPTEPTPPQNDGFSFTPPPPVDDYRPSEIPFLDIDEEMMGEGDGKLSEAEIKAMKEAEKEEEENIQQVARWIVDLEDSFIVGFIKDKSKISERKVKIGIDKHNVDDDTAGFMLETTRAFNKSVDSELSLSKEDKKSLVRAWADVLRERPEIVDSMTPEMRLVISHAAIGIKMFRAYKNIKAVGDDILDSMNKHFKALQKMNSQQNEGEGNEN